MKAEVLKQANSACKNTLMETLHIEIVDFGDNFLIAKMPVTPRVHQPMVFYTEEQL
ncbi:ComA operon protein 2 [Jejuia pallidilutea]|uniref:ComA operon protein 2 n=1 Tax=Jejuia pallidilutea TaxID=504487 RepID=A0A090WYJ0_9FLAO|nr:ComA operon protein 2 [Jejuia pallidilutea]